MTMRQVQPIPVRKGWPLFGVLPEFIAQASKDYFKNVMLEQGDLVRLDFGPKPVYLVSHPDYLQRILRDNYQTTASRICFMRPRERSLARDWSPAPASYGFVNDG